MCATFPALNIVAGTLSALPMGRKKVGKHTTLRLTEADDAILRRLTGRLGLKRSQVIRVALRRLEARLDKSDGHGKAD